MCKQFSDLYNSTWQNQIAQSHPYILHTSTKLTCWLIRILFTAMHKDAPPVALSDSDLLIEIPAPTSKRALGITIV
jgi:hypothetical protein